MQIRNYTIGLLLVLLCCTGATAQSLAEKYRSNANPYYWKNRMPDAAYWQQDVAYTIKATIHEQDNSIEGTEALQYFNNSPDTLYYVYFHLYQNAFINGSYLHQLELLNKVKPEMGEKERVGLGIMVNNVK
ncbi:MAG: M1 family peptidase, partial [Chitinophagia bacterium]|nr:M1 family peptidase [Chitinophagia bacterium]